jgi:carbamoyltransferase
VDYSARVQLKRSFNRCLPDDQRFDEIRLPVILNTSFNVRGEPIVGTPERISLPCGRTWIICCSEIFCWKKDQKPLDKDIDWLKEFELD